MVPVSIAGMKNGLNSWHVMSNVKVFTTHDEAGRPAEHDSVHRSICHSYGSNINDAQKNIMEKSDIKKQKIITSAFYDSFP